LAPFASVVKALWHVPPLRVHVPSAVAPLLKVTVPVAAAGATFAVSVTLLPTVALVVDVTSVVVVGEVTVTFTALEVLAA
jgi:hypothetical protein